jgi:hypothetical protein
MIRLSTLMWLALVGCAGFGMFEVKYEVMQIEDQLARVDRAVIEKREAIHVLDAEWSFLTQPSRIDQLAHRYLALGPISNEQLTRVAALPMRQPPAGTVNGGPPAAAVPDTVTPAATPAVPGAGTRLATAKLRIQR